MSCEDCGIELNDETRSWPVHTLCHVCETNDWWSSYGGIDDTIMPATNTGSLRDAVAMNLVYVMEMKDNLENRNYKGKSLKRGARQYVTSTKRECDTCGHHLPNNLERWKTKCYRCYKLFKDGTLAILPSGSESKQGEKTVQIKNTKVTKSPSTQNASNIDDLNNNSDNWVVVTDRRKVKHLDKIRLRQDKEQKERTIRDKHAQKQREQRAQEEAENLQKEHERNVKLQMEMEYWNKIREAREKERQEEIERQKLIARMSESDVIVSSSAELIHLPEERIRKLCLEPTLIRPVLHEFYTDTIIEIQRDENVIRAKGPCFSKSVEWTYEPHQISLHIICVSDNDSKDVDTWNLCLQDEKVARYFWSLWHHELQPFDEHVYETCPFILSFYTGWKKDPYYFRGVHKIHDHDWCQYNNDGNEILIDGGYFFFFQRRLLYAGIQWCQKHVYSTAMLYIQSELLPQALGNLVCAYYENVDSDYVKVDNVRLKPNSHFCRRDLHYDDDD
jgi:hypothetical protein